MPGPTNWDEFRAKYPGDAISGLNFNQGGEIQLAGPGGAYFDGVIDLDMVRRGTTANVSNGVCRELCRMWIFVRNTPGVLAGLNVPQGGSPELAYLRERLQTIMVAQALGDEGLSGRDDLTQVGGMAKQIKITDSVGSVYRFVTSHGGALAMGPVAMPEGKHAIAFDTRNHGFVLFDPNRGMITFRAGLDHKEMLRDYYSAMQYTPLAAYRYSRC